jgi:RecA-family ATPase
VPQGARRCAGKSFLALDWALSVAAQQNWMGQNIRQGGVVYIYAEGANGLKKRIRAWKMTHAGDPEKFRVVPQPLEVVNGENRQMLFDAVRKSRIKPSLLVIDTLARCFGGGDENATSDMSQFVAALDAIRSQYPDVTVLVVHHSGKDATKGDRGSTALRAAADTVMRLDHHGDVLTLKCEKQKDAEAFKDIGLALSVVELEGGETSCILRASKDVARELLVPPFRPGSSF